MIKDEQEHRKQFADAVVAWADGIEVQHRLRPFEDISTSDMWFNSSWDTAVEIYEYRIKPQPKPKLLRYRIALMKDIAGEYVSAAPEDKQDYFEQSPWFMKWVSELQEIEV